MYKIKKTKTKITSDLFCWLGGYQQFWFRFHYYSRSPIDMSAREERDLEMLKAILLASSSTKGWVNFIFIWYSHSHRWKFISQHFQSKLTKSPYTSIFFDKMEYNLHFLIKWKTTSILRKCKTTLIFRWMEDDLNFFVNGKKPQCLLKIEAHLSFSLGTEAPACLFFISSSASVTFLPEGDCPRALKFWMGF